ncbi:MAG: NifB/NifX family molybdenum-iron cluster-binding protein [Clostridiaceae bacterium]|nr:NifB/NifX family molybdenum-iron cluster-binding protein [Clostridiaceae bacterium]
MSYRVAFASSDGKVVNQHFGRAKAFHIVEIDDKDYRYIETRVNEPSCKEFEHTEDSLKKSISVIKDCKAVFVAKVGQGASYELYANGIKAIEAPYFIEDILFKLVNSKVKII